MKKLYSIEPPVRGPGVIFCKGTAQFVGAVINRPRGETCFFPSAFSEFIEFHYRALDKRPYGFY